MTDRIVIEFFTRTRAGENVRTVNKSAIARAVFGAAAGSRRSMVSRVWDACLAGEYGDHPAAHTPTHTPEGERAHTPEEVVAA